MHSVFSPTARRAVQRAGHQLQRGQRQLQPAWPEWGMGLGWVDGWEAHRVGMWTEGLPPVHLCSHVSQWVLHEQLHSTHPAILL